MPNEKVSDMVAILAAELKPTDLWMVARPLQENFSLTHSEFLSLIVSQIFVSQTIFVDSIYGNDGTGLRERVDKPFQTIVAAANAAIFGDTVYIRSGNHDVFSTILVQPDVNFYAEKGVIINSYTILFNLDTNAGGITLNGRISFRGYAIINDWDGAGSGFCVIKTNPNAILDIDCDSLTVQNISNGMVILDGTLNLNVRGDYYSRGRNFSMRLNGNLNAVIGGDCITDWASNFTGNFWISVTGWSGVANIKARTFKQLQETAQQANIYTDNMQGGRLYIKLDEVVDFGGNSHYFIDMADIGTTQGIIFLDVIGLVLLGNKKLFRINGINFLKIYDVNGTHQGATVNGGEAYLLDFVGGDTGPIDVNAGLLSLRNTSIQSPDFPAINVNGGILSLMSSTIITNGVEAPINNIGGVVLSEGSKGNVAPVGVITGNFYVNPLYTN